MPHKSNHIKVLYNESHSNVNSKVVPQGGPSRFAQEFRKFFQTKKSIELCPLLFSHEKGKEPYIKETCTKKGKYFEISYETMLLRSMFHDPMVTRKIFNKVVRQFVGVLSLFMSEEKPDVVFLNGYGMNNWMLMLAAYGQGIPVVIQHAGIWKKEIPRFRPTLAPFIRKAFYDMERDTIKYCAHHIFLNEFSRKTFIRLYKRTWSSYTESSIIPLPIVCPDPHSINLKKDFKKDDALSIGMVARWDSIKNHNAVLRLAESKFKPAAWKLHAVTVIGNGEFFEKRYKNGVQIHAPMQPKKLVNFYRSMDMILLPSHFDVSPTVAAESLRAGTPVIISDHVGWQDTFRAFDLSDHIVPRSVSGKKLVQVIYSAMVEQHLNAKKYEALRLYIEKKHNPESVFKQYSQLFLILAKNKKVPVQPLPAWKKHQDVLI